jgi:hypothetical protein
VRCERHGRTSPWRIPTQLSRLVAKPCCMLYVRVQAVFPKNNRDAAHGPDTGESESGFVPDSHEWCGGHR